MQQLSIQWAFSINLGIPEFVQDVVNLAEMSCFVLLLSSCSELSVHVAPSAHALVIQSTQHIKFTSEHHSNPDHVHNHHEKPQANV